MHAPDYLSLQQLVTFQGRARFWQLEPFPFPPLPISQCEIDWVCSICEVVLTIGCVELGGGGGGGVGGEMR